MIHQDFSGSIKFINDFCALRFNDDEEYNRFYISKNYTTGFKK